MRLFSLSTLATPGVTSSQSHDPQSKMRKEDHSVGGLCQSNPTLLPMKTWFFTRVDDEEEQLETKILTLTLYQY